MAVMGYLMWTKSAEVFSHGCQIFKRSEVFRNHFCDRKWIFPRLSWWCFPTLVKFLKTPKSPGSTFVIKIENSHTCHKYFMVPENQKNSKQILKIIQNFPRLLERAGNAKKCGKFQKIVGKKLWNKFPEIPKYSKNIWNFSTAVKRAENAIKSSKKSEKSKV